MKLLIKNGRVVDPENKINAVQDILIEGSLISRVAKDIKIPAEKIIDAKGKIVMPGMVDMHVHLREPGREDKETIESGTKAALKGGVTCLLAMSNTVPAIDCVESIRLLKGLIKKTAKAEVLICAAVTKGRWGKDLTAIAGLKKAGAVAISDDGSSVDDEALLLKALKAAQENRILLICHCEDQTLSANGVINLGAVSTRLGLRGISKESEYKRIERDISLAEKARVVLHICHVSCAESVEVIARAKKKGIKITADTCPHYFSLSEEALLEYDTNMKINPPLRTRRDVEAIKQGLKTGTIDAIASDHAPHTENEKDVEFDRAEFGSIGLETELAASITALIKPGLMDWPGLVKKLSLNPARILGIDKGSLKPGKAADIIIVEPNKEWTVSKEDLVSKSKNSCFIGSRLKGCVVTTILNGRVVYP